MTPPAVKLGVEVGETSALCGAQSGAASSAQGAHAFDVARNSQRVRADIASAAAGDARALVAEVVGDEPVAAVQSKV